METLLGHRKKGISNLFTERVEGGGLGSLGNFHPQCGFLHWFFSDWGRREGRASVEKVFRPLLPGLGVFSDTGSPSHPQPAGGWSC